MDVLLFRDTANVFCKANKAKLTLNSSGETFSFIELPVEYTLRMSAYF